MKIMAPVFVSLPVCQPQSTFSVDSAPSQSVDDSRPAAIIKVNNIPIEINHDVSVEFTVMRHSLMP